MALVCRTAIVAHLVQKFPVRKRILIRAEASDLGDQKMS